MIVNLSVDTSSADLMDLCKDIDAFYIDTVCEPWPGLYTDGSRSISERSNYALREGVLDVRRHRPGGVTAVSCCGANPGMVSWMVKQALIDVATELQARLRRAHDAQRLGAPDGARRRQGHPHRRARHPACPRSKAAGQIRQHLVGGRLHRRRLAALRARLGHAREDDAGWIRPPFVRLRRGDLLDAPGAGTRVRS